jgi:hypothetical protein
VDGDWRNQFNLSGPINNAAMAKVLDDSDEVKSGIMKPIQDYSFVVNSKLREL